jgi:hypothetical protein
MTILEEAQTIVSGARQASYGTPERNWERTAKIASALTGQELSAELCIKVLLAVKFSRLLQTPNHRDSLVDAAGYCQVLAYVVGVDE